MFNGKQQLQLNLIALFALFSTAIMGQNDYKPGYIISNKKDTLYGLINSKSEIANSKTCAFKRHIDANVEVFMPFEIYAYRIENEKFYISKEILNDSETDSVFLEFLVEGVVNLYYLNKKLNEYYYLEKEGELVQLSNEDFEKFDDQNTKFVGKTNQYKGTLRYLFQDSPELINKINATSYLQKPLIKITEDYHNTVCKDNKCINYKKNTQLSIFIEPLIGFISSKMGIKTSSDYLSYLAPSYGVNLHVASRQLSRFWNYIIGINYSKNSYQGDFNHSIYNPNGEAYRVDINYTTLRIPLLIEYSFTNKKIQPILSLGYNNILLLDRKYSVLRVNTIVNIETGTSPTSADLFRYQFGFIGGLGVKYHVNKKSYLHLKGSFEYRISGKNSNEFLDYQRVKSFLVDVGYCMRIK